MKKTWTAKSDHFGSISGHTMAVRWPPGLTDGGCTTSGRRLVRIDMKRLIVNGFEVVVHLFFNKKLLSSAS